MLLVLQYLLWNSMVVVVDFVVVAVVYHETKRREKTDWRERESPAVESAPPRNCGRAYDWRNGGLSSASIPSTRNDVDLESAE
jgi:hypothetical protein